MSSFSTSTTQYNLIKDLSTLRQNNDAVAYGSHTQRWINNDVYIYERQFYNSVVLVAINKNDSTSYPISGLNTALPAGNYSDYLGGLMGGPSITVGSGSGGNNPVTGFTLKSSHGCRVAGRRQRACVRSWLNWPNRSATWGASNNRWSGLR